MDDIEVMVMALNAMRDVLTQTKSYDVLNSNAKEIISANITEMTDLIVRYCKDNYDV